ALLAMMIWTLLAYQYKIPTSESHSVIAAITGAAVAVSGNIFCINFGQWTKVLYGIILSLVIAFLWGWLIIKVTAKIFGFVDRRKTFVHFKHGQIASAAALSFMHGAQDGQKFVGVFLIGIFLSADHVMSENFYVPLWLVVLCGAFMAMGTFYGGRRMRKAVGLLSIKVEKYQGFSIDLGATLCLFGASLWGIPMSMKHTKISALLGVEAAK
ncbi:MAG: inorganic phosphate transporter, partial [Anaerovorax sp.]